MIAPTPSLAERLLELAESGWWVQQATADGSIHLVPSRQWGALTQAAAALEARERGEEKP